MARVLRRAGVPVAEVPAPRNERRSCGRNGIVCEQGVQDVNRKREISQHALAIVRRGRALDIQPVITKLKAVAWVVADVDDQLPVEAGQRILRNSSNGVAPVDVSIRPIEDVDPKVVLEPNVLHPVITLRDFDPRSVAKHSAAVSAACAVLGNRDVGVFSRLGVDVPDNAALTVLKRDRRVRRLLAWPERGPAAWQPHCGHVATGLLSDEPPHVAAFIGLLNLDQIVVAPLRTGVGPRHGADYDPPRTAAFVDLFLFDKAHAIAFDAARVAGVGPRHGADYDPPRTAAFVDLFLFDKAHAIAFDAARVAGVCPRHRPDINPSGIAAKRDLTALHHVVQAPRLVCVIPIDRLGVGPSGLTAVVDLLVGDRVGVDPRHQIRASKLACAIPS